MLRSSNLRLVAITDTAVWPNYHTRGLRSDPQPGNGARARLVDSSPELFYKQPVPTTKLIKEPPLIKRISITALTIATLCLLVSGATGPVTATNKEAFQEAPHTIVLRAARMLEVQTGRIVSPAVLVIEKGRIKSVNPSSVPPGQLIDLGDTTLLPGFIDMHTHLSFDIEGAWIHRSVTDTAGDSALRGARNARNTLLAGFTTVRNLGSGDFLSLIHI